MIHIETKILEEIHKKGGKCCQLTPDNLTLKEVQAWSNAVDMLVRKGNIAVLASRKSDMMGENNEQYHSLIYAKLLY